MFKLPHVPSAEDLIDIAYRAGSKEGKKGRSTGPKKLEKVLTGEIRRVETIGGIVCGDLDAVVKYFPRFEDMTEFHQHLLDLRIKKDRYKKSLATVRWASERVESIKQKALRKLKTSKESRHSSEFLGRTASFIKRVGPDLKYLQEAKKALQSFPLLKDEPTLVVAGIPNAGKSTFVKSLTGSNVRVAPYPFTTTEILIGYRKIRHMEYQIVDSPGILDRPMSDRNNVELQAVLAIKHLADVVLFIIDPQAGIESQLNLLKEIRESLGVETVTAVNDKGTGVPEGYDTFNATNEEDCVRIFRQSLKI